jgi:glycosyltransferase involved in cell wall biosynthesis
VKLSILIPVYNVEDYLGECVHSILSQAADLDIEIILLDDCSTDNSRQLCVQFCEKYPDKIRFLIHEKNSGLSAARNSLLDAASGEYIWFLDSDDYLLPGSLLQLQKILASCQPDLVICDYRKNRLIKKKAFKGRGGKLEMDRHKLVAGVFRHQKMYSWNKISRRGLWGKDLRFPVGKTFEDIATTPQLLLRCVSFYYVPESWLFYRTRPNSIMTSVSRTKGFFDAEKHDDMASAMCNIKSLLQSELSPPSAEVEFYASHFIAKEFVKLAERFDKAENNPASACGEGSAKLNDYFEKMQNASPIAFDKMLQKYAKRLNIYRFVSLYKVLRRVRNETANDR